MKSPRRKFIKQTAYTTAGLGLTASFLNACSSGTTSDAQTQEDNSASDIATVDPMFFSISLAQWSLHNAFFGDALDKGWPNFHEMLAKDPASILRGDVDPLDFPAIARNEYGIDAIEYVNVFYFDKAKNQEYLNQLKQRCDDNGVSSVLIMCDSLGNLGDLNDELRRTAVENHYAWVEAAKFLGCHSIRVNAAGNGTAEEVQQAAIDGLGRLSEYGAEAGINIIVENHGGYSSDGLWLAEIMRQVNMGNCGTLPDFGNFCIESGDDGCVNEYDRYKGVSELMPYAKGVSAKTHDFDAAGNETHTDFSRMLTIVKEAGYTGHIGIEYEGSVLSEPDGIKATKALLENMAAALGASS